MAELKTKRNDASVSAFLNRITDANKRRDARAISVLMQKITKSKPKMWGASIVGFGSYHYKYASGREGDAPITGFSPRKQNLTLYIMGGFERNATLMKKLGKYKTGKACLYINSLSEIDVPTLKALIQKSVKYMAKYAK